MAVSNRDHGMTTIQIQVLRTLIVPYMASLSLDNIDIKKRIYVEKFHNYQLSVINLESAWLQFQSCGLLQSEHEIHVVHGSATSSFKQIVDAGNNH